MTQINIQSLTTFQIRTLDHCPYSQVRFLFTCEPPAVSQRKWPARPTLCNLHPFINWDILDYELCVGLHKNLEQTPRECRVKVWRGRGGEDYLSGCLFYSAPPSSVLGELVLPPTDTKSRMTPSLTHLPGGNSLVQQLKQQIHLIEQLITCQKLPVVIHLLLWSGTEDDTCVSFELKIAHWMFVH